MHEPSLVSPVCLVAISIWFCMAVQVAHADIPTTATTANATGVSPYQPYDGEKENISLSNGNLNVFVPLISFPGRNRHDFDIAIEYDSKVYSSIKYVPDGHGGYTYYWDREERYPYLSASKLGWRLSIPSLSSGDLVFPPVQGQANCTANFLLTTSDGSKHSFHNQANCYPSADGTSGYPTIPIGDSNDNSYIRLDTTSNTQAIVILKNGTRLYFPYATLTPTSYPTKIEDTNGNMITINWSYNSASPSTPRINSITDTASRVFTFHWQDTPEQLQNISYLDSNGNIQTISFTYAPFTPSPTFVAPSAYYVDVLPGRAAKEVLSGVTFPTGNSYTFTYNGFAEMTQITYPSGGYTKYDYGRFTNRQELHLSGPAIAVAADFREVTDRRVCSNPSGSCATEAIFTYSPTVDGTKSNNQYMDVRDPVGNRTHTQFTFDYASNPRFIPQEVSRTMFQGESAPLQTITTDYTPVPPCACYMIGAGLPIRKTTTLNDTGQTTKVEYDYDTYSAYVIGMNYTVYIDNPLAVREYQYGSGASGPLLRTKTTSWLRSGPYSLHILDLALSNSVTNAQGSFQTQFEYDNYSHSGQSMLSSGAVQHDSTFGTTFTTRGNPTAVSRWLNTTSSLVTTVNQYDDAGNILSSIDPLGHQTSYSYADAWGNATCAPSGGNAAVYRTATTDALNHTSHATYNSCTGTAASTTDANNLKTTFTYDFLGRLTQTNLPNGGHTSASYNDVPPVSITTTVGINTSQSRTSTSIFDGVSRPTQTQTSDPQGTVYTDTTYDALGRVYSVSNPYRAGSDATSSPGTTTYGYDALGRKTSATYPDGSILTTAYCGSSTLVTDPTLRWRRSRIDALGYLVEVDEPNAAGVTVNVNGCPGSSEPIWVTFYTNDALGNLTQVVQNGSHQRTFTYDSLSRLLTSNNPETGTITYTYNADSNVLAKKDARNITSSYTYDALHREKTVSYSNNDPGISTNYDEATCLTGVPQCNNIGHRTSMTDAAGSEIWAYDVPDRIYKEQRTTSGITKTTTYNFDFAGNVTSIVYPTLRTVNYTYDSADRPSTASDGLNGITYATGQKISPGATCLVNITCYTPQGSFYALSIGQTSTFTGLNLTHSYNKRLQPNEFKASSTGGAAIDISYNFVDPVSGKNSGHVYGITNNLDTTRSQTLTYDQLNRITSALTTSTHASSPAHCWGEAYQYDNIPNGGAWGNLTQIAATTNPNYNNCAQESGFSVTADGSNHITGFGYDASGNATSEGSLAYVWNGESQLKSAGIVNYLYDGDGRRVSKVGSKLYWYGFSGEVLDETDSSGNTAAEYIFFGGKRVASIAATTTAIQNASFETYNTLNQSSSSGLWNTGPIPNWTLSGTGGSFQPSAAIYTSLPAGPTVAYNDGGTISQTLTGIGLQPNTTYTLSVYIGHRLDGYITNYTLSLQAGSTVLQSISGSNSTITAGMFANIVLTYTTGSTVAPGDLTVVLTSTGSQIDFDGVQLTGAVAPTFYVEDLLGTSRVVTTANGVVCYDADFYPYGGERPYTNTCSPVYKFEGKERDTETGNDDFGARYYSNRFGRWLSADWSGVPVAVPYANLSNPQTLNLYAMVADDPESFADLDGHEECFANGACNSLRNPVSADHWILNGISNTVSDLLSLDEVAKGSVDIANAETTEGKVGTGVGLALLVGLNVFTGGEEGAAAKGVEMGAEDASKAMGGIVANGKKGIASETSVLKDLGVPKNTESVVGKEGKSIPDFQTSAKVGEIKDAKQVSNTKQLRIQKEAAHSSSRQHELHTGTKTHVTKPAAKGTKVIRRADLGPKQ
jgi:RHS repeat-associated protein